MANVVVKKKKVASNIPTTKPSTGFAQWTHPLGTAVLTAPAANPAAPTTYRPAPSNVPLPPSKEPPPDPLLPFNAALEQRNASVDTELAGTLGGLEASGKRAAINYGFKDGNIDFSDPASRAAMLQRHWMDQKRGTGTRYGARGQAFSGAFQRAQQRNNENESIGYTQLGREYQDVVGGIAAQGVAAKGAAGRQKADAFWEYAQSVAQNAQSYR